MKSNSSLVSGVSVATVEDLGCWVLPGSIVKCCPSSVMAPVKNLSPCAIASFPQKRAPFDANIDRRRLSVVGSLQLPELQFSYQQGGIGCGLGVCGQNIRALIVSEVLFQIPPLAIRHDGIADAERNANDFQKSLPPIQGLVPGLIGLIGIAWGWSNVRIERRLPLGGIVFLVGRALWAWASLVILPWSVRAL